MKRRSGDCDSRPPSRMFGYCPFFFDASIHSLSGKEIDVKLDSNGKGLFSPTLTFDGFQNGPKSTCPWRITFAKRPLWETCLVGVNVFSAEDN